jgi:hypothetical protein
MKAGAIGFLLRDTWHWHVNENGWLDIGYNFLIDHFGNIYEGRYNPSIAGRDVQGAHAGRSNSSSTGIALLGQFEPGVSPAEGQPEVLAVESLERLIAWRFSQRNIFDQEVNSGEHEVLFHPEGLASGVYFYRFSSSGFEQVRQMLYVR